MHKYLQIALNEKKELVSIYDVETGEKCNCTCPYCNQKVIAKNKNKTTNTVLKKHEKIAHFSHYNDNCQYAGETAIHLLAKEVFKETKKLLIPPIYYKNKKVSEKVLVKFDTVHNEKFTNGIRPDSVAKIGEKELFIEFHKTHKVDLNKIEKIKKLNISCLEIDLRDIPQIINNTLNKKGIINLFEKQIENKTWLNNIQSEVLFNKKKSLETSSLNSTKIIKDEEKAIEENKNPFLFEELTAQEDFENFERNRRKEIWFAKLKTKNYSHLKVYPFEKYEYEGYYDKSSETYTNYKRHIETIENVYCPLIKNKPNRIELYECENCQHHKAIIEGIYPEKRIACNYKKL